MGILDASVAVEMVLRTKAGRSAWRRFIAEGEALHAPHLLDLEVMHALRRFVQKREVSVADAEIAVGALAALDVQRHAHMMLSPRVWQLRDSITPYDAAYVALAETLGATLFTRDAKLSRSHGHNARIELLS